MGLGEIYLQPMLLRLAQGLRQIPFECVAIVILKQFRIRPIQAPGSQQLLHFRNWSAQSLEQKNRVRIFQPHFCRDVFPHGRGDHVTGIATESIHALPAPMQKDLRHFLP